MQFRTIILILAVSTILLLNAGLNAQDSEPNQTESVSQAPAMDFPYIAQVVGENVNLRSGPGMNYYRCSKIGEPNTVTVVETKFSWSKVVPLKGCFSWISKQYVKIEQDNPSIGVVTGDDVRVWAGSDFVEPMYSTSLQTKLDVGDTVQLLGEEKSDYYKITPPAGAYLWISSEYLVPVKSIEKTDVEKPVIEAIPSGTKSQTVVQGQLPIESKMLKEYNELTEKVEAESQKPLDEQNYTKLKNGLAKIAEDPNSGKAGKYAKFQIAQIDRYELAAQASDIIRQQDSQLEQKIAQIDKQAEAEKIAKSDLGMFAVMGTLKKSRVFDVKAGITRYMILDDQGKLLCYAVPMKMRRSINVEEYLNQKVGLVGKIEPDIQTGSSIVKFTSITSLEDVQCDKK